MKPTCFLMILLMPSIAIADGFSSLGNYRWLQGLTIVEVGNVRKVKVPIPISGGDKRALLTEEMEFLGLNLQCFHKPTNVGYWGYGEKAGMLLTDRAGNLKLAILKDSVGSIEVQIESVSLVECPDSIAAIQRSVEEIKKQVEETQKKSQIEEANRVKQSQQWYRQYRP